MSSTCAHITGKTRDVRSRVRAYALAIFTAMLLAFASSLVAALIGIAAPQSALADDLSFVAGSASKTVRVTTAGAKEQVAYNRALAACRDYRNTIQDEEAKQTQKINEHFSALTGA